MHIKLGTRGSKLALVQTKWVKERLEEKFPQHTFEVVVIQTKGDLVQHKALDQIGGKGLFVKEIEQQILDKTVDLGVHSMKDMPSESAEGLCFTKTWSRADRRDALILKQADSLEELPHGAVLATGSKRRVYQLKSLRPDLQFVGIRGNIDTRLKKMREREIDGLVLAAAGLHRMGLGHWITQYLDPQEEMVPACAQGALALEIRQEDETLREMLDSLCDEQAEREVQAERAFLEEIGGGCHTPAGACAYIQGTILTLTAWYGASDGSKAGKDTLSGDWKNFREIAKTLAQRLKKEVEG